MARFVSIGEDYYAIDAGDVKITRDVISRVDAAVEAAKKKSAEDYQIAVEDEPAAVKSEP